MHRCSLYNMYYARHPSEKSDCRHKSRTRLNLKPRRNAHCIRTAEKKGKKRGICTKKTNGCLGETLPDVIVTYYTRPLSYVKRV